MIKREKKKDAINLINRNNNKKIGAESHSQ